MTDEQVADAMERPLKSFEPTVDDKGRKAQKLVGRDATVVVNPDTGVIITTYRTKSRYRRKYERELGGMADGDA